MNSYLSAISSVMTLFKCYEHQINMQILIMHYAINPVTMLKFSENVNLAMNVLNKFEENKSIITSRQMSTV